MEENMNECFKSLLEKYIHGIQHDTLSVEERLNLIEFFANDPDNLSSSSQVELSEKDMERFMTIGWLLTSALRF